MTNEELGKFGKWLNDKPCWHLRVDCDNGWARAYIFDHDKRVATGPECTSLPEAIAALADKVMPPPQCCGTCAHCERMEEARALGTCKYPMPFWIPALLLVRAVDTAMIPNDCPAYQRRPE